MIDIENDVFTAVAEAIRTVYPNAFISSEYVETPARFPAVTVMEADNRVLTRMRTLNIENAISSMIEINIYSNKSSGKKAEAKAIAAIADAAMSEIGYTRTFREQVPNLNDATIHRIVCRYEAVVDKDLWIYQNY